MSLFKKKQLEPQKEFCINPNCPHHNLDMKEDLHYHEGDEGVANSMCGILYTHKVVATKRAKKAGLPSIVFFCDICSAAIDIYNGVRVKDE